MKLLFKTVHLLVFSVSMLVTPAVAKNLFAPAITVNDKSITYYEIGQRETLLKVLKAPGNPNALARKQLIEDRLKVSVAEDLGVMPTEDEILKGMDDFSARARLDTASFINELSRIGVDEQSFRDFIVAGIAWRNAVQSKFGARSQVSDTQLERTINSTGSGGGLRVLLTEIILPAPPGEEDAAHELAKELSKIKSQDAFSDAARQYSVAPTRTTGGRVKWQNLDQLPPVLKPLIFGLAPGDVTDPLPIPNGIAIFQLRAIEETNYKRATVGTIDYLTYSFPAASSGTLDSLKNEIDHCDDLYGVASKNEDHVLTRLVEKPENIKRGLLETLNTLDAHEKHFSSTADTTTLLMLCARSSFAADAVPNLNEMRFGLRNKRLENYAEGFLQNLYQDARIITK
ncbi:MAG: peptidylprolyl isomerase [Paracoccaceae bacterium]